MKTKFIFHILLMTAIVFLASCVKEGPIGLTGEDGLDGQDGQDGQDGNVTCLACHSGTTISARQFQYASSIHKAGTNVAYAGGRAGCAQCHSSEGFIEFQANGLVASDISMPSAINCETCHIIHTAFTYTDFALRSEEPVGLIIDQGVTVLDIGDGSNLCINCHQARTAEPQTASVAGATTFRITNTHYGPHHGPQANIFAGQGFAEITGPVTYPVAGSSKHLEQASCTVCHMDDYIDKQGGHTFKPSLAACQECHATENFDYGGVQFDTEEKLTELRDLLISLGVVAWYEVDQAYEPVPGTYPMVRAQAYYNWIGIEEDRSLGVHNPQYVNALLTNTIAALKATK
ncbi:MAG TPA: hypothetical protein DCG69_03305 [Bacteroidales bacterium]|nr:hypothetical protein [Bacteroidales bacterium]